MTGEVSGWIRIGRACFPRALHAFLGDVTLLVEWNSEGLEYATQNNYDYLIYTEGFNG